MNIIFLDVDGVLNSINKLIEVYNETHKPHSGYSYPFDERCLENLKTLVNKTNSKIVITSTWRKDQEGREFLLNALKEYELDKSVLGYTPVSEDGRRESEIKEYLSSLNDKCNFVILDDDMVAGELLPYLIKTNTQTGLTYENVQEAIRRLNITKMKPEDDMER